jgi:hypothetical protein
MPKFKKSSGFRMGGYSYPGTSPVMKNDDAVIEAAAGVAPAPNIKVKTTEDDAVIEAAAGTVPNIKVKTTESEAKGYNKDEAYFQALLKATQENPEPKSHSKKHIEEHQKSLHDRARQIQILDYTKKSLTPAKKKKGPFKMKGFSGFKKYKK